MKKLCILLVAALMTFALPAYAVVNPVVSMDGPTQVYEATGLLLPIPDYAENRSFSVIDGTVAQAEFSYEVTRCSLRQSKSPAFEDISGVYDPFEMVEWDMEDYEGLESFTCKSGYDDQNRSLALWYDLARGVSGSLYAEDMPYFTDRETQFALSALARGVCAAEDAACANGSFTLSYPTLLTEDAARTEALNRALAQSAQAICAAQDSAAAFQQQYRTIEYYQGRVTIEWGGWTALPDAAYSPFSVTCVTVDLSTGELAPLRGQADTAEYAKLLLDNYHEYLSMASWDDDDINDAQAEYFSAFTLEDWKALLDGADFPCDGWPSAFSRWARDEYETNLILHVPVQHAIGDQASFVIPAIE